MCNKKHLILSIQRSILNLKNLRFLFFIPIIIYDDHIKFFFNYKEHTETITFDELNNCSDLPDSPRPKGQLFGCPFLFYF